MDVPCLKVAKLAILSAYVPYSLRLECQKPGGVWSHVPRQQSFREHCQTYCPEHEQPTKTQSRMFNQRSRHLRRLSAVETAEQTSINGCCQCHGLERLSYRCRWVHFDVLLRSFSKFQGPLRLLPKWTLWSALKAGLSTSAGASLLASLASNSRQHPRSRTYTTFVRMNRRYGMSWHYPRLSYLGVDFVQCTFRSI